MKNLFFTAAAATLVACMLTTCRKSDKNDQSLALKQLFTELEKPLETATFQAENKFVFTSKSYKTRIIFQPNSFEDEKGRAVTGAVNLEFREIYTKGDMIRYNRPTQSIDGYGLESGGEMYIRVSQNGQPLRLKPGVQAQVNMYTDGVPVDSMDVFYGTVDPTTGLFGWEDDGTPGVPNVAVVQDTSSLEPSYYQFFSDSLDWINCDYFISIPNYLLTSVCSKLPGEFNLENTVIFIVFSNRNSVMEFWGIDTDANTFCQHNMPIGDAVTIVSISALEQDGNTVYYLAHATATVTPDLEVELTPVETPLSDIEDFLDSL